MSVDHKRPLLAFAVVTIACAVILVNAVRSEAFVSLLRAETSHVVAGLGLAPTDHRPGHRLEREPEAALAVVATPEVVAPVQHLRATPHHRAPFPQHRETRAATRADQVLSYPAREHAHQHGRGHDGDPYGRRVHRHGREHGHHRGHGDHADHAHEDGDGDRANARELEHPSSAARPRR